MLQLLDQNSRLPGWPVQHGLVQHAPYGRRTRLPGQHVLAGHPQLDAARHLGVGQLGFTGPDGGLGIGRGLVRCVEPGVAR